MLEIFKLLKIGRRCLIFKQNSLSQGHGAQLDVTRWRRTGIFQMFYFRNEGHYRSGNLLSDKSFGVLSHGGNKNLAGLANVVSDFYDVT